MGKRLDDFLEAGFERASGVYRERGSSKYREALKHALPGYTLQRMATDSNIPISLIAMAIEGAKIISYFKGAEVFLN